MYSAALQSNAVGLEATPGLVPDMLAVAARPCSKTLHIPHYENRLGKNKNTKGRKGSSLIAMVLGRAEASCPLPNA